MRPLGLLLLAVPACSPAQAPRPLIAMFTQDIERSPFEVLAASYVKWVEQAGARVVPIRRADTDAHVAAVMARVDGLLLPGGGGEVPQSARSAFSLALAANKRGVPMPVWGTCLGFEWLMEIASEDVQVLHRRIDAENISLPLQLRPEAEHSRMLGGAPAAHLRAALSSHALTLNNHQLGVTPDAFESHPQLGRFFDVLSTSVDRRGLSFVSTAEARGLPIFATQWHPEKAQFEWGWAGGYPYEAIDHSQDAVAVSQHLANVFVSHARVAAALADVRGREPPPDDSWSALVWQFPVVGSYSPAFVQTYLVGSQPAHATSAGASEERDDTQR
jgi:gamma-glutamyl hydrolase